jgi:hypothetical protein
MPGTSKFWVVENFGGSKIQTNVCRNTNRGGGGCARSASPSAGHLLQPPRFSHQTKTRDSDCRMSDGPAQP